MDFYDLKSVLAIDLSPVLAKKMQSRKVMLPNTALHWFYTVHANRLIKHYSWIQSRLHNPEGTKHICISVLRLYYSSRQIIVSSKSQYLVELMNTIFHHTSGIIRCNQAHIPKMWAHLFLIFATTSNDLNYKIKHSIREWCLHFMVVGLHFMV